MLQVIYRRRFQDVVKYIVKGLEVKYFFKMIFIHLKLVHVFYFLSIQPYPKNVCRNDLFETYDMIRLTLKSKLKFKSWIELNWRNPLLTRSKPCRTTLQPPFPVYYSWVATFQFFIYLITSGPPKTNTAQYLVILIKVWCTPSTANINNPSSPPSFLIQTFMWNSTSNFATHNFNTPLLSPEIIIKQ